MRIVADQHAHGIGEAYTPVVEKPGIRRYTLLRAIPLTIALALPIFGIGGVQLSTTAASQAIVQSSAALVAASSTIRHYGPCPGGGGPCP